MKKLLLISALLIFACSSDDSSNDNNNNDDNNNDIDNNNNNSEFLNCDGNPFPTIVYGTQEWIVENACYITYRDGTPIPQETDPNGSYVQRGAWHYHLNDPTKPILYNWYAVMGIHDAASLTDPSLRKEFAPDGWHVPSDSEWTTLEEHLIANGYNYDGTTTGNKIAKAMASTTGWYSSTNTGAPGNDQSLNNSSGFNAFPEGESNWAPNPLNNFTPNVTFFWTSTNYNLPPGYDYYAYNRYMDAYDSKFFRNESPKQVFLSVRFVKD